MAKYVCDFEEVYAAGEKLCQAASDMTAAVSAYSTSISSDLSSWTGVAKNAFDTTNTTQVGTANTDAQYINALGEFVKDASKKIQTLEEELASLSI